MMATTPHLRRAIRRPISPKLQAVLDAIPADRSPIRQTSIYDKLGYAEMVGNRLYYLCQRGLIEETPEGWRRRPIPVSSIS